MGRDTKIQWAHHSFNFWRGCQEKSPGCDNCYAAAMSRRNPKTLGIWGPNGTRVVAAETKWKEPLRWDAEAKAAGVRYRVFCDSMSDFFEDFDGHVLHTSGVPMWLMNSPNGHSHQWGAGHVLDEPGSGRELTLSDVRARAFDLIDATPNLDWLICTKRPENILKFWPARSMDSQQSADQFNTFGEMYHPNVWLLTSVENQEQADKRVPELLECRDLAPVLGLSCEPLLGPVDLIPSIAQGLVRQQGISTGLILGITGECPIDWVIDGNESGPGARPGHIQWSRSLRDQCLAYRMAYFKKQWGEWVPESEMPESVDTCPTHIRIDQHGNDVTELTGLWDDGDCHLRRVGKAKSGRSLDGVEWNEFPQLVEA